MQQVIKVMRQLARGAAMTRDTKQLHPVFGESSVNNRLAVRSPIQSSQRGTFVIDQFLCVSTICIDDPKAAIFAPTVVLNRDLLAVWRPSCPLSTVDVRRQWKLINAEHLAAVRVKRDKPDSVYSGLTVPYP